MSSTESIIGVDFEDEEEVLSPSNILVGSGEYTIVGIRYYSGVAHPGEFVQLIREPNNPYDPNAIRVDNLQGEKVGHIKATMAKSLAVIMDGASRLGLCLEGTIPREGNAYVLPLTVEFYCTDPAPEAAALSLKNILKRGGDHSFRLAAVFSNVARSKASVPISVERKKLDWNTQQEALDKMFDKQLENQYNNLPTISIPSCLTGITLLDYQVQGIKWLVKKETSVNPAPFYKKVKEKKKTKYLCEITRSSQVEPPKPIKGSILCDEMGLGKSIQTIGLILLAPPSGVKYKVPIRPASGVDATVPVAAAPTAPTVRCTLIVCPVSVLSNWTHQINSHVHPGVLSMELYHGPSRDDVLLIVKAGKVDILLVSYHTLSAEYGAVFGGDGSTPKKKKAKRESIFDVHFHRIVLDEAHIIRSDKTKFFKSVKEIKADRKLALTGTPFVNQSTDIFSLLSFLGVQPLDDKTIFTRAITQPIKNGDEIGLTRLRACMGFVSLRRSKQDVNIKLVEKDVQLCSVEFLNDAHKKLYDALFGTFRVAMEAILGKGDDAQALKNYTFIFEKLLRLRQACCSGTMVPKERRDMALKLWKEMISVSSKKNLSAEEGLALLEKLKGAFEDESNGLPECAICLMEMEQEDGIILKNCSHVFCKLCIQQVLSMSNKKCPLCRGTFNESDIIDMSTAKTASEATDGSEAEDAATTFSTPPKIMALLDAIKTMKPDEKGVIFSQFTKYLDLIGDALKEAGHSFVKIDGSVSAAKRISLINSFNSDGSDTPRFILCSLLASGTGINLTRANWAFMLDVWWNEAMESQAMDRIHRINQTRNVNVLRFVMKDSIEERIVELQERKSIQSKGVMSKLKGDEKRKALLGDLRGLLHINEE